LNNNRGNNRRRGRGSSRQQGGGQQVNRIDSRARGNAPQLLEKYRKLAHDAHLNGDRVTEEYYLQFADHYFRVIADQRQRQEEHRQRRDERWQEGGESEREREDGGEYGSDYGMDSDYTAYDQPHRREREERPPRQEARAERVERDREPEPRADPEAAEASTGEAAAQHSVYEPAENPFVREGRSARGLRPRREDRRPRREPRPVDAGETDGANEADTRASVDPAVLPPAISAARDEAEAPAAEEKPRRRTRRPKPPADDAGETLEVVTDR
jgi:hypothetical protein